MENFSLNPLKWFKRASHDGKFAADGAGPVLKPRATPRKSGNLFMHLITLQKSLQSLDLALRQEIDCSWLIQKIAGQLSVLKLEAEVSGEEELGGASGQVLAYFETISEGRLELDTGGVTMMREFVHIFKDAIGDAGPGVKSLDHEQLSAWNARYQRLMSKMRPMSEELSSLEMDGFADDGLEDIEKAIATEETESWMEPDKSEKEAIASEVLPEGGIRNLVVDDLISDEELADSTAGEEEELSKEMEAVTAKDAGPANDLPVYDPQHDMRIRDAVIADEEIKTAPGSSQTNVIGQRIGFEEEKTRDAGPDKAGRFESGQKAEKTREGPVQIEEVERLKKKLLDLHERQEKLSSKMSGLLGGYQKAVKERGGEEKPKVPTDELDIEELENLIFIGRKKG